MSADDDAQQQYDEAQDEQPRSRPLKPSSASAEEYCVVMVCVHVFSLPAASMALTVTWLAAFGERPSVYSK